MNTIRKIAVCTGFVALAAIASSIPYLSKEEEFFKEMHVSTSYSQAHNGKTPALRKTFLNELEERLKQKHPGLEKLVYDNDAQLAFGLHIRGKGAGWEEAEKVVEEHSRLFASYLKRDEMGKGMKAPVFVFPRAFSQKDEAEFMLGVIHEMRHIDDYYNGIIVGKLTLDYDKLRALSNGFVTLLLESRAYHDQLAFVVKHDLAIERSLLDAIVKAYLERKGLLAGFRGSESERAVAMAQLKQFQDIYFERIDGQNYLRHK